MARSSLPAESRPPPQHHLLLSSGVRMLRDPPSHHLIPNASDAQSPCITRNQAPLPPYKDEQSWQTQAREPPKKQLHRLLGRVLLHVRQELPQRLTVPRRNRHSRSQMREDAAPFNLAVRVSRVDTPPRRLMRPWATCRAQSGRLPRSTSCISLTPEGSLRSCRWPASPRWQAPRWSSETFDCCHSCTGSPPPSPTGWNWASPRTGSRCTCRPVSRPRSPAPCS